MLSDLKSLYAKAARGRRSRYSLRITLTNSTMDLLREIVKVRKGGEASPFIELCVRTMIALLNNGDDLEDIAVELGKVSGSPYLADNLERLGRLLKA